MWKKGVHKRTRVPISVQRGTVTDVVSFVTFYAASQRVFVTRC